MKNRQVVLASRPNGYPQPTDFALVEAGVSALEDAQVLVKNFCISLDAGFRNWMNESAGDDVLPAMPLGQAVMGLTLARVLESKNPAYAEGDILMARFAWEEYSISKPDDFIVKLPRHLDFPHSYYMGILGDTGMSAYFALTEIAPPKAGETVLVSAAGGAVGSVAGQIAGILGARRVGISSSPEKCARLVSELGYDAAVNRKDPRGLAAAIAEACPDGVDVFIDNVGGETLEAAITHMNHKGRIALIGAITHYNDQAYGPKNLFELVTKEITMRGFLTHYREDQYEAVRQQLEAWISAGKLKNYEHKLVGIENVGRAFCEMFNGDNFGKTVVELDQL